MEVVCNELKFLSEEAFSPLGRLENGCMDESIRLEKMKPEQRERCRS